MYRNEQVLEHHFKGLMNEVQVWSKALTKEEIRQYLVIPPTTGTTSLIGLWLLDGDYSDTSGMGNDAEGLGNAKFVP